MRRSMYNAESGYSGTREMVMDAAAKFMTAQAGILIIGTFNNQRYEVGQTITRIFGVETGHPFVVASEATPEEADQQGRLAVRLGVLKTFHPVPRGPDDAYWKFVTD